MSKNKYINCKIYPLEYLINEELTETDLYNCIEGDSFLYSAVIEQFRRIGDKRPNWQIIKECKEEPRYVYNHKFPTVKSREDFTNDITKAFKNIFVYGDVKAESEAQWFMFGYGFSVNGDGDFMN